MVALVIDDSRTVRILIRGILRELGMEVVEAIDGQDGLNKLHENTDIELVLVDWNMPVMTGIEFIERVRNQSIYDTVRIVMVTSETESSQVTRALNAGANEYVMKPFGKDVLVAKLSMLDMYGP